MKEYFDLAAAFISQVGFPVFVAIVLLWRDDQRHHENVRAMNDLVLAVKDQHLAIHCRAIAKRRRAPRRS